MAEWYFAEQAKGSIIRNPTDTRLFTDSSSVNDDEYAGTSYLVREVIQNSLDAAVSANKRVRVVFSLYGKSAAPKNIESYLKGLRDGLEEFDPSIEFRGSVPLLNEGFLVCEDFGTRGLEGDPELCNDPDENSKSREDFFWFWRNYARSDKQEGDLGRWGLGKAVYRAASRIGTMLGLTIRNKDKRALLMGQAVLKVHKSAGKVHLSDGFWGKRKKDFVVPIESNREIAQFKKDWHLQRDSEPGLSVVVPYVAGQIQSHHLVQAVIVNFVIQILLKKLEVVVRDPNGKECPINAGTIGKICDKYEWNGSPRNKRDTKPHIEFFREALAMIPNVVESELLGELKVPNFDGQPFSKADTEQMRTDLISGRMVGVRVNIAVPMFRNTGGRTAGRIALSENGSLLVFLKKTKANDRGNGYAVRDGMTLSEIRPGSVRRNIDSLVLVEKGVLSSFLGDVEGASHEKWNANNANADPKIWTKWVRHGAQGRCSFCSNIADSLEQYLKKDGAETDRNLFADYFSLPDNRSALNSSAANRVDRDQPSPDSGEDSTQQTTIDVKNASSSWFQITQCDGGFRVSRNKAVPVPKDARFRIMVAYETTHGNAFAKWNPFDFDFHKDQSFLKEKSGLKAVPDPDPKHGNQIVCGFVEEEFSIRLAGFDQDCELVVDVRDITAENEAGETE